MSKSSNVVFSIYSPINGFLKVVDTPSGRELISDKDFFVSISEKHKFFFTRYWGIYTNEVKKLRPNYKRILCLGLGGGSIQNELFKNYPGVEIVTIELDPLINDIHKFYFSGDQNDNHKILNMDAKVFLKYPHKFGDFENYFDLIFVDIFSSMNIEEFDKIKNFYNLSKKLLKKNGVYSLNVIVQKPEQYDESQKSIKLLSEEFEEIKLVYTPNFFGVSNLLIFASDKINP